MDESKRGAMLRREYEAMLKARGISKSKRVGAACSLTPDDIARLLPLWRRAKVALA